jgi:PAT family beta-lactamase induction signal transducer AmpG
VSAAGERKPSVAALLLTNRRVLAICLLSISSGTPIAFILTAFPGWMFLQGFDIKAVGLLTLVQAPYAFKLVWSPLLDRYAPPFLGRKRGWVLVTQGLLALLTFAMGALATDPSLAACAAVMLLISFAAASQDIAYDAYVIESLGEGEEGPVVAARSALYRFGMFLGGSLVFSFGGTFGWSYAFIGLSLLYVSYMAVTFFAVETAAPPAPPQSLAKAAWEPFVGFMSRKSALQIAAFVLLYRLADSLAGALVTPFLTSQGYSVWEVGAWRGVIDVVGLIAGSFVGGWITYRFGLGRSLWIFGFVQALSNLGYVVLANFPVTRVAFGSIEIPWMMYSAIFLEVATSGMGSAAFGVLLIRLTEKRFSATQFAMLTSFVGLARLFTGPVAGLLVDSVGWSNFFWLTVPCAVPGLVLLQRFAPFGSPETANLSAGSSEIIAPGTPATRGFLWRTGALVALAGTAFALLTSASLMAFKNHHHGQGFEWVASLLTIVLPTKPAQWVDWVGASIFGLTLGVATAAYFAARGRGSSKRV